MLAPCSWPIDRSGFPALPTLSDPPTVDEQAAYDAALAGQLAMEDLAVFVLWRLSGEQFGVCKTTIRPCADRREPGDYFMYRYGAYFNGAIIENWGWSGLLGCGCGNRGKMCRHAGPSAVPLPGPVYPIVNDTYPVVVTIGDEVLDEADYVIEDGVLIRRGGKPWPFQDHTRPLGECGTWSVTYWKGVMPPRGVGRLVGLLALEFIRAAAGDGKCRLPKSVTRVQRQGVSYEIDPTSLYALGKTGIPEIDTWLMAVNPNHIMQAPSVL